MTGVNHGAVFGRRAPVQPRRYRSASVPEAAAAPSSAQSSSPAASDGLSADARAFLEREKRLKAKADTAGIGGGGVTYAGGQDGVATGNGVWFPRVIAFILDTLIVLVPFGMFFWPAISADLAALEASDPGAFAAAGSEDIVAQSLMGYVILAAVLNLAYFIVLEASPLQATLGKYVLGLAVADSKGERPGLARVIARNTIGKFLSNLLPFYLGYIIGIFNADKKCVHDFVAGTTVRRRL